MEENNNTNFNKILLLIVRIYGASYLISAINYWTYIVEDFVKYNQNNNYINFQIPWHVQWNIYRMAIDLFVGFIVLIKTEKVLKLISWGIIKIKNEKTIKLENELEK